MTCITGFCRITTDECVVDHKLLVQRDVHSGESWFRQIYREQEFVYPKFHKMDALAQAGVLASELIKRAHPGISHYEDDQIGLLFANQSSSADTDARFVQSYGQGGSPSPSLFVYTLPNIVLGEIAILNKWYGEQMFAVLPAFDSQFYIDYASVMNAAGTTAFLCGWVEVVEGKTDVLLFLVERNGDNCLDFNATNIEVLKQPARS